MVLSSLLMPHFSDVLGNKAGDYFYSQGEDQGELKGVRIFLTLLQFIKG